MKKVSLDRFVEYCPEMTGQAYKEIRELMGNADYTSVLDAFKKHHDLSLDHVVQNSNRGSGDPLYIHTGTGDIYDVTLVYDFHKNIYWLGCLADYMEKYKNKLP